MRISKFNIWTKKKQSTSLSSHHLLPENDVPNGYRRQLFFSDRRRTSERPKFRRNWDLLFFTMSVWSFWAAQLGLSAIAATMWPDSAIFLTLFRIALMHQNKPYRALFFNKTPLVIKLGNIWISLGSFSGKQPGHPDCGLNVWTFVHGSKKLNFTGLKWPTEWRGPL